MKDLKIRVSNEAESKEVQELFFKLGYKWFSGGKNIQHPEQSCGSGFGYLVAWSTGCFTNVIQCGCGAEDAKEITLQEFRDMVNPMKEYLEKQADGSYKLVMRGIVGKDDDIEVPDGAEKYIQGVKYPTRFGFVKGTNFWDGEWIDHVDQPHEYTVVWKRHTQPEELPFVDSLNDQYAEIEQVRKQTIEATLAERQAQYGCFEDVAFVTENIMAVLSKVRTNGLNDLPHTHRMALYMIASKMARIVNGDFNSIDGWHDISGYATLVERLIDG